MADLGQFRLALHTTARLMLARIKPGESCRLTRITKAFRRAIVRQQHSDTALTQPRDTIEQMLLFVQRGISINVIVNPHDKHRDLLVQPLKMLGDTLFDGGACHQVPIRLPGVHHM